MKILKDLKGNQNIVTSIATGPSGRVSKITITGSQTLSEGAADHTRSKRSVRALALPVLLMFLLSLSSIQAGRRDPETFRVRILYIGDGWGPSPVPKFQVDPAFTCLSIPASQFHVGHGVTTFDIPTMRRFVRLYMPRTFDSLLGGSDLLIFSDANVAFMGNDHLRWFREALLEHGLGIVMVGGLETFGAPRALPWTPLEDLLPVDFVMGPPVQRSFKLRTAIEHPFTESLPWNTMPYFHSTNKVTLKQSATLLMTSDQITQPPLSYADFGEGRSVAHSMDWTPGAGRDVMEWEYYPDYVANIAFLATRNEIPQDAELLHELRVNFWTTTSRLTIVVDTLGFVERFGANTRDVEDRLGEVTEMITRAEELYIEQEYQGSRELIYGIDELIIDLNEEEIDLKDRALFWVYLTEWTVTTGAALLAGSVLWSLMVRRRLYREVGTTRTGTKS